MLRLVRKPIDDPLAIILPIASDEKSFIVQPWERQDKVLITQNFPILAQGPITEFDITITSSPNCVSMPIATESDIKDGK